MNRDFDFAINQTMRAANVHQCHKKVSKEVKQLIQRSCATTVSFMAYIVESMGKPRSKKTLTVSDVLVAARTTKIPGLYEALLSFIEEPEAALNEDDVMDTMCDAVLTPAAEQDIMLRFASLTFPQVNLVDFSAIPLGDDGPGDAEAEAEAEDGEDNDNASDQSSE